jgi:hypothetical protein
MARSSAYWAGNLYRDAALVPAVDQPERELPAAAAARFQAVRAGLAGIGGVTEHVKYMAEPWRWTWEYSSGGRRLCWLHPVPGGPGATFTIAEAEEPQVHALRGLPAPLARAMIDARVTGPLRWCAVELTDRRIMEAFLDLATRKAGWLGGKGRPRGGSAG